MAYDPRKGSQRDGVKAVTVGIVDNDRFARRELRRLIESDRRHLVVWDRSDAMAGVELCVHADTRPDILLLDMSLGETDGVNVCRRIRRTVADMRILGITAFPPRLYARDLASAGAQGLIGKDDDAQLWAALRVLAANGTYCPDDPDAGFLPPTKAFLRMTAAESGTPEPRASDASGNARTTPVASSGAVLTPHETDVLSRYAETGSYRHVARELGIGESTARNIMAQIRRKLGTVTTMETVVAWRERRRNGAYDHV